MSDAKEDGDVLEFSLFTKGIGMLWKLLYEEKRRVVLIVLFLVLLTILNLAFLYLLKLVFDEITEVFTVKEVSPALFYIVLGMACVKVLELILYHFVKEPMFLKVIIRLENLWPMLAQKKLLALSFEYHEKENTGKKIAKISKGCDKMVDIIANIFWVVLPQLLYLAINTAVILFLDWRIGLLFLIPLFAAAVLNLKCYKKFAPEWERYEKKKEVSVGYFCQSLINVSTVQNFVKEEGEGERFSAVRRDMESLDSDVSIRMQRYFFAISAVFQLFFVLMILCGAYFVFLGEISAGTIVYVIATGNATVQGFWNLVQAYVKIMKNFVAVIRMKELLDEEETIADTEQAHIPTAYMGHFCFQDVSFAYQGKEGDVLRGISLDIKPGEMAALVGRSGGGKTTIMRLLSRVSDPTQGVLTLDGKDIRDLPRDWYRGLFATVSQNVEIFDDTISANVAYAFPEAPKEEVCSAIRAAHLSVVLEDENKFPDGIQTCVGDRGVRFSGGECQRVGIARALIALNHGAKVLLLDEATSNLDSESERAIQDVVSVLRNATNVSIVVIAHRLSTIRKADKIYVVGDGRILEEGDHNRFLEKNGLYARLVDLQHLGELVE
ncbi:MAG: ABC transporter ATP-binding protein [Parcubacteria group bacterium]|nr:ABC transporter ATP-binding protein [Parcubacteria group bacterium]